MQHSENIRRRHSAGINLSELNARSFSSPREYVFATAVHLSRSPADSPRAKISRTHNFIEISRAFHGSVPGLTRTFFYSAARKMAAARDARSAGVTMKNPPRFVPPFFPLFFFSSFSPPFFRITPALVYTLFYFNAHDRAAWQDRKSVV